jgi:FdrA protein
VARDIDRPGALDAAPKGPVGIVANSRAAVQEITCLLARDQVGVSQLFGASPRGMGKALSVGLQALQADPVTSVIVLASRSMSPAAVTEALARIGDSDKPTIVCLLGSDPRSIWKAGAIPAARLDEAAMRAAAWARGWDQALISSRLEDQDEQMAGMAHELQPRFAPARCRLYGLFTDEILGYEAQLMLSDLAKKSGGARLEPALTVCVQPDFSLWQACLRQALADPQVAVILLDLMCGEGTTCDPVSVLAAALDKSRRPEPGSKGERPGEPWIVARLSRPGGNPRAQASDEARLWDADVILAPSNATMARLAGMIVGELCRPTS